MSLGWNSYQAALAYGEASKAIEMLSEPEDSMRTDIDQLLSWLVNVTIDLRDKKKVEPKAVSTLDRFFNLVGEAALSSRSTNVETVEYQYERTICAPLILRKYFVLPSIILG
jgi:hypothetical protein